MPDRPPKHGASPRLPARHGGPQPGTASERAGLPYDAAQRLALGEDDVALLEEALAMLEPKADRAIALFYGHLFVARPDLRAMFPVSMTLQRERLFKALGAAVTALRDPQRLAPMLYDLGRDHRKFGVQPEHYAPLGDALLAALRTSLADVWAPEVEATFRRAYTAIADLMQVGAQAAQGEPAWWLAEVVGHDRRGDDLAVITVRTDRPYPFTAGQYTTVETPYRPRMWRPYSIANAPYHDDLLELHVRAVPGGWVSNALVWRAEPGDVFRLGPPAGRMSADPSSRRDVLLVAGGTGLSPLKAIVEEMGQWNAGGNARRATLFVGARHRDDLYDLASLRRFTGWFPWLRVVPAVSEDPHFDGARGLLPDVVADAAPEGAGWREHDVYVCGSPAMVRATLARLGELAVPPSRIRYDTYGEVEVESATVIDLNRSRSARRRAAARAGGSSYPGPGRN